MYFGPLVRYRGHRYVTVKRNKQLSMKLDQLLAALTTLSEKESVTEADVAKAIQDHADKAYHTIFRSGFSESETRADAKLKSKDGEILDLTSKLDKSSKTLEEVKKGGGDSAVVVEKYENALKAKDEAIAEREALLEKTKSEFSTTVRQRELAAFRDKVRNKLVSDGVDPDIADAKVQLFNLDRVELGEDYSVSRILQPDGATPYPVSKEVKPYEYISKEIYESVPERLKQDRRQQGSHLGNGGGESAPRFSETDISKMSDADYEKNREAIFRATKEGRISR